MKTSKVMSVMALFTVIASSSVFAYETDTPSGAAPRTVVATGGARGPQGLQKAMDAAQQNANVVCRSSAVRISDWKVQSDFGPVFTVTAIFNCVE